MKVFVDTNILLDVLMRRRPFYAAAAQLWTRAETAQVRASVSALSLSNVYYIVRKLAGKRRAAEALRLLRDVFDVTTVDRQIVDQAIDSDIDDFEDAVQYFCALRARARYLVTRDPKGFPGEGPTPISAEEFIGLIQTRT